ncbi:hypothetical protein ZTR_10259 [Talaromyces verruculosus]|nr:hypothetical protein ZTR_10259 [Talaromyces verruculosus]
MIYLESFIFTRVGILWENRNMPSYLGPSIPALCHLFILLVVNSLTLFALFVLLVRSIWAIGANVTTIESWEIERHKTLLRRARYFGGYLDGPDGMKVRIRKQEFPYDVGILSNVKAGMGGSWNILSWFWPLASTPDRKSGLDFEVNEFEDPNLSWPPPDPDRIPRKSRPILSSSDPFTIPHFDSPADEMAAFRQRQQEDLARRAGVINDDSAAGIRRRRKFHERYKTNKSSQPKVESEDEVAEDSEGNENEDDAQHSGPEANDHIDVDEGEEAWRNAEGERLDDFGVDEDVEFYDEEDVPLSVLKERIKAGL